MSVGRGKADGAAGGIAVEASEMWSAPVARGARDAAATSSVVHPLVELPPGAEQVLACQRELGMDNAKSLLQSRGELECVKHATCDAAATSLLCIRWLDCRLVPRRRSPASASWASTTQN